MHNRLDLLPKTRIWDNCLQKICTAQCCWKVLGHNVMKGATWGKMNGCYKQRLTNTTASLTSYFVFSQEVNFIFVCDMDACEQRPCFCFLSGQTSPSSITTSGTSEASENLKKMKVLVIYCIHAVASVQSVLQATLT